MADEEKTEVATISNETEAIDRASFLQGWLVGRRLAGMRHLAVAPEPVAYLYNGVRLLPIPKYDKEKYPYFFLGISLDKSSESEFGLAELFVSSKPLFLKNFAG